MPNDTATRWLTQETAAEYLSISVRQLQALQKAGKICASYFLGPRSPRYDRILLDRTLGADQRQETQIPRLAVG